MGTAAVLQVHAADSATGQTLTCSATDLSINAASGLISGTPTAAGTSNVTVTAKDGTGPRGPRWPEDAARSRPGREGVDSEDAKGLIERKGGGQTAAPGGGIR
ncbi:Ig domain-containing protein [Streptomyces sp. NBC_00433]